MITMTVNHVDIESYAIHRCLKTVGKVRSIHKSTKGDAIMVVYFNKKYEYQFSALYNRNHPDSVVVKTDAFDIRYENGKTELCKTKIEKLVIGNYLLLYNELTKALSALTDDGGSGWNGIGTH